MAGLDPLLNVAPPQVRHVHLMGVCGTGVGALAGMFKSAGFQVSGSDQNVYPPMSDFLAASGIVVRSGYGQDNLVPRPDLVVVGNVITRDNPEAVALAELGIPYLSMPQALGHFFIGDRTSLVVTGTHGKTTTSSLLATALHRAGREPSFLIGGLVQAFGSNFNLGGEQFFVVEGDEYDTAFFDKGPKFLHYRPKVAIITSIEFDHADIYADLEAVKASFRRLVALMPTDGCLVAYLDDPVVRELTAFAPCRVIGYGRAPGLGWQLAKVEIGPQFTTFTACKHGTVYGELRSVLPGVHNSLNCLAVTAVLDHLGMTVAEIASGLASFGGVKRRQEVRGVARGVTVIDDFAHHPTAVRETLAALRGAYPEARLIAVFDPRTNSSRRRVFQDAFASCFGDSDLVLVREPEPLLKIAPEERFSAPELVAALNGRGVSGRYFPCTDAIITFLAGFCEPGDVVVVLSNGGFDNIHARLLACLQG